MVLLRIAALAFWAFYSWSMGQTPPSGLNDFGRAISLSFFVAMPLLYLLPTFEAWRRGHESLTAIALINIFLGWSLIGWVAAMAWVFVGGPRDATGPAELGDGGDSESKTCPFCAESIRPAAIKCKHCGSMLVAGEPATGT